MSENEPTPGATGEAGKRPRVGRPAPIFPAIVTGLVLAGAVVLVLLFLGGSGAKLQAHEHRARLLLGDCQMIAVMRSDRKSALRDALHQAELEIRGLETRLAAASPQSETASLNAAKAGSPVPLSPPMIDLLRSCRDVHAATGGAFDVTTLPMVRAWERCAAEDRVPAAAELAAARAASAWDQFDIQDEQVVKRCDSAGVEFDEAARAFAVDRAAETLAAVGAAGGIVSLGGNVRCFGKREDGSSWAVDVMDPFRVKDGKTLMTLHVSGAAVCTVAHYTRYVVIGGRSYSLVLNPETGLPASGVASATVVAPTALQARAWATALCSQGDQGLRHLPRDIEAMLVVGTAASHKVHASDGFQEFRSAGQ